ncbi:MAG TPA: hypothetical protein VII85_00385, partial [Candidatus Krumholzibacteriaceae bacterium]
MFPLVLLRQNVTSSKTDYTIVPIRSGAVFIENMPPLTPLIAFEWDPSISVELDPLDFESDALLHVSFGDDRTKAQAPTSVDDPMPRHGRTFREGVESIAYLTGVSGDARELRYLAVGGDT